MNKVQIYRFYDRVAINIYGATIYLQPCDARAIAKAFNACARDIKDEPIFGQSSFDTVHIVLEDKKGT